MRAKIRDTEIYFDVEGAFLGGGWTTDAREASGFRHSRWTW